MLRTIDHSNIKTQACKTVAHFLNMGQAKDGTGVSLQEFFDTGTKAAPAEPQYSAASFSAYDQTAGGALTHVEYLACVLVPRMKVFRCKQQLEKHHIGYYVNNRVL